MRGLRLAKNLKFALMGPPPAPPMVGPASGQTGTAQPDR